LFGHFPQPILINEGINRMKKPHKVEKNFTFEIVALAIVVRRDFSFETMPLNIRSDWYSLKGLNCPNGTKRTKSKKLYKFLKANKTRKQRDELMRRCIVLFD